MRDLLTEASPFDIISSTGEILYSRVFKNPELYRPHLAYQENPDQMSKLMSYGATEQTVDSTLRVILESESWRFISTKAKIGVYNKAGEPREYTVKVTEMQERDMLPPELKDKYSFFDSIFRKEDASEIS